LNSINIINLLILWYKEGEIKKILFIVIDGLADRPIPALSDKTPLSVANTPNLNKMASQGVCGIQNALKKGEYPTSEEAHMSLFGYDYINDLPGRGVLEGLGLGIEISKKQLVLRVDFGTVDDGLRVIDPRAGNIKSVKSFCEFIGVQKIGPFTFTIYPGLAHRAVLVIEAPPVSREITHHSTIVSDTDPHKAKVHRGGDKVIIPKPLDDSVEAAMTADALWKYQQKTHQMLDSYLENKVRRRSGHRPANFILTRGAGFLKKVEPFQEKYGLLSACVAGAPLYKGIAKYIGMDVIDVVGATGGIDTDILAKVKASIAGLKGGYDFIFMHLKGADVVAEEEGDFQKKIAFFEKADKAFAGLLDFKGIICITGDHATPCILKDHSDDPVPILIYGNGTDSVDTFNEVSCQKGSLGYLTGAEIMPKLIKEAKNV
jgi:2,3-bisphosphoglycerate-independent phosphoglycerate mutase